MSEKKQARLVKRGRDITTGAPYEVWDLGDGRGIYVDFYESDSKAFPVDMGSLMVDGGELRSWPYDATGGKAIRELGYEPVEEGDEHDTTPTGDERREVAAKLRKYISYAKIHDKQGDYVMESNKCIDTRCTLYNDIASCIENCGNFNLSAEEVFTRLADLIDPSK